MSPYPVAAVRNKMSGGGGGVIIPRYDLLSPGTVLEDFESAAALVGPVGTVEDDAVNYRTGTQSVKFTSAVGSGAYADKVMSRVFGSAPWLRYSFYLADPLAEVSTLRIYISSVANVATYFIATITLASNVKPGWNTVDIAPGDWSTSTGEDWGNTMIRLRPRFNPAAGQSIAVSADEISLAPQMLPAVLFTFDDANETVYTVAYNYMHARNKRGTFYVITDDIGSIGGITALQLQEMNTGGWDIGNHTSDHTDLTTLSQVDAAARMTACQNALDALGLTRASRHLAYPGGGYNDTVRLAMIDAGMLTGRLTGTNKWPNCIPDQNYQILSTASLAQTLTLATAKAYIDTAVASGRMVIFYGHTFGAVAGATQWVTSDFQELVDYCVSLGLPFLTISDFYNCQSGPVRIP